MDFLGPYAWLIAIFGGAIVLGIALAFGMKASNSRTPRQDAASDRASKAEYAREDRDAS